MNVTVNFTAAENLVNAIKDLADSINRATAPKQEVGEKTTHSAKSTKAKAQAIEESFSSNEEETATSDDTAEETTDDVGFNSPQDVDDDTFEYEIETPKKAAKAATPAKLTLEKNIIPAFQAFAKKHSREKAGKVLAKYKVKSVRDLPTTKFPEILKLLGA